MEQLDKTADKRASRYSKNREETIASWHGLEQGNFTGLEIKF